MPYKIYGLAVATRDDWLQRVLDSNITPKPPNWWLRSELSEKNRSRTQASIIWTRHYDAARKFVIWSQAPDEDFRFLGYLE